MSDWKPGDVAMLEVQRGGGRIGLRDINNEGWRTVAGYMSDATCPPGAVHRPLVVIDPESAEDVERLFDALGAGDRDSYWPIDRVGFAAALREFAAPTPPRPDEPQGLGAVVVDGRGIRFVRTYSVEHDTAWVSGNHRRPWAEIEGPRVLSEGVTP